MERVFASTYFGPISYYDALTDGPAKIDLGEHFVKQSYRSRCVILGANGPINLTVPLRRNKVSRCIKDLEVDYTEDWQKMHWRSIMSAYGSSPYFEYFDRELEAFFAEKSKFLVDQNQASLALMTDLLQLELAVDVSHEFIEAGNSFRDVIHPKKPSVKSVDPYTQVFSDRMDFVADLSILDLLFNEGSADRIATV